MKNTRDTLISCVVITLFFYVAVLIISIGFETGFGNCKIKQNTRIEYIFPVKKLTCFFTETLN